MSGAWTGSTSERKELTASLDRHESERRSLLRRIAGAAFALLVGVIACTWRFSEGGIECMTDRWWVATAALAILATSRGVTDAVALRDVRRTIRALQAALRRSE